MVICDRCEGKDHVKETKIAGRVGCESPWLVDRTADLCEVCRQKVKRAIEQALEPLPKVNNTTFG